MKKVLISSIVLGVALLSTTGCAPKGYAQASVGESMTVEPGVVQSVRQVQVNNNGVGNTLGGIVGAVAGGAAGNHVGGGTGQAVATVAASAIGGVLGGMAGDNMDNQYGQEIVVKLDSGKTVATVLRINGAAAAVQPGQAVNVFFSRTGGISNIVPR
jgi:outer membrane lipoprotein SlyB